MMRMDVGRDGARSAAMPVLMRERHGELVWQQFYNDMATALDRALVAVARRDAEEPVEVVGEYAQVEVWRGVSFWPRRVH